jgi:type I restriction enzyme M protein
LTDKDIEIVAGRYHAWRGDKGGGKYSDTPGLCKATKVEEIRKHAHVLTPGRYAGAEEQQDDGESFEKVMTHLSEIYRKQQAEAKEIDATIADTLRLLGYGN